MYGFYSEPVELARVLHNLEHGGVYMLYGPKTPADTVELLREIYDRDPRGLVVAPLPELGDEIALGAWTSPAPGSSEIGTGHLAKCTAVDKGAFEALPARVSRARPAKARASTSCSPAEPRSTGVHSGRRGGGTGETRPP